MTTSTHDLDWIRASLQTALELEFSTLPLYLSSMLSLRVQNYTAYNAIRSVVMEEMVHMAIAGNMIAALGGNPQVAKLDVRYPVTGLPGGVEPDLHVGLAKYSRAQLELFLRIEQPLVLRGDAERDEAYPTISAFYEGIREAVRANADSVRAAVAAGGSANQMGDDIGFTTITHQPGVDAVESLCDAIDEILVQGEGASADDLATTDDFEGEESHYAKFAALYYGAGFTVPAESTPLRPDTVALFFQGRRIPAPNVVNTLAVPSDGYAALLGEDPNGAAVGAALAKFDTDFSTLLGALDVAWNGPASSAWKTLGGAVGNMMDLRVLGCFGVMGHEVPPALVGRLPELYPEEIDRLAAFTDLEAPVFYGPRFVNTN